MTHDEMTHDEQIEVMRRFIRNHGGVSRATDDLTLPGRIIAYAIDAIEALEKRVEALERRAN